MTGWQSKKESGKVRWLGPYAPTDRHADDVTLAELVRLRVENQKLDEDLNFFAMQITILHDTIADLKNEISDQYQCPCRKRDKELEQMFEYFDSTLGQNQFNGGD